MFGRKVLLIAAALAVVAAGFAPTEASAGRGRAARAAVLDRGLAGSDFCGGRFPSYGYDACGHREFSYGLNTCWRRVPYRLGELDPRRVSICG
jgi:hypothetical protein